MASVGLSNRERVRARKAIPRAPRIPKGEAVVRVAASPVRDEEMDGRDGLAWLKQKGRITALQLKAAMWCSDLIRDAGEVALPSCLEVSGCGGSAGGPSPSPIVSRTDAKRHLFVVRYQVLRGQPHMLMVIDGICGARHTLRYLAGGDKHRARDLETILKIALDLVAEFRWPTKKGD